MEHLDRLLWCNCSSCLARRDEFYHSNRWCAIPLDMAFRTTGNQETCYVDAGLDHLVRIHFSSCGYRECDDPSPRIARYLELPNIRASWLAHIFAGDSHVCISRADEHVCLQDNSVDRDGRRYSSHLFIRRLCGGLSSYGHPKQCKLCLLQSQRIIWLVRYIYCLELGNVDMCLVFHRLVIRLY